MRPIDPKAARNTTEASIPRTMRQQFRELDANVKTVFLAAAQEAPKQLYGSCSALELVQIAVDTARAKKHELHNRVALASRDADSDMRQALRDHLAEGSKAIDDARDRSVSQIQGCAMAVISSHEQMLVRVDAAQVDRHATDLSVRVSNPMALDEHVRRILAHDPDGTLALSVAAERVLHGLPRDPGPDVKRGAGVLSRLCAASEPTTVQNARELLGSIERELLSDHGFDPEKRYERID